MPQSEGGGHSPAERSGGLDHRERGGPTSQGIRRKRWAGHHLSGELSEASGSLGSDGVPDPRPTSLPFDPAGFAQDLEMVGDRRLADPAACGELAGTDRALGRELTDDGEARRVGNGLQEEYVGIGLFAHRWTVYRKVSILTSIDTARARSVRSAPKE